MSKNSRSRQQVALVIAAVLCGLSTTWSIAFSEETCSTANCVKFIQFGTTDDASQYCRRSLLTEKWAFSDACCAPSSNPDWCSTQNRNELGSSTRKIMAACTPLCTSGSCGSGNVQPFATNMFVEYVNATRYECRNETE